MSALQRWVPVLSWAPAYKKENLRFDVAAGVTTAVMLIPQGMAYAMLAGLPPIVGLYASIVPLIAYALFGTSRELAVGPVAMVSLMVASSVGALAQAGSGDYVAYAVLLALMIGVMQVAMGVFRLGFLVNFLSHPVVSGFTSAAALIIGLSQLKHLLGVSLGGGKKVHLILWEAVTRFGEVHVGTLVLGIVSIAVLVALKRISPRFPRALVVVAGATLAVWGLGLNEGGMKIVGDVPAGLPSPTIPQISWSRIAEMAPTALAISLVGFMESISVAKAFASRARYELNPNQELIGLGAANVAGSFFGAYPVTGGFSRTAVNAQAGAKSGVAPIVTAALVALTLLFLTPLFYYLPQAVLAAIIMTAVFGLIDIKEVKHLWKVKRTDLALLALTFVSTLALGIEEGIGVGVAASLVWFVAKTTQPHYAVLGRLPGTSVYRNVKNFSEAQTTPGVLAVRFDAQFYFGNVTFLKETLKQLEVEAKDPLRAVVLDASSINQLDSSADTALFEVADDYEHRGIQLYVSGVKGPVREVMKRSGFLGRLGDAHLTHTVDEAMDRIGVLPKQVQLEQAA